jgi:hypothetical protein
MKHKIPIVRSTVIILVLLYLLFKGFSVVIAQQAAEQKIDRAATIAVTEVNGAAQILSKVEVEKQKDQARVLGLPVTEEWKPAFPTMMLNQGDQIRTGVNSSMKAQLNDGTTVMLSSDTLLIVEELKSARGETPQTMQFKLEKGKITTQQGAKILGQTVQIIRTENGSVNTRMAEVEVQKSGQEAPREVTLAALPEAAQRSEKGNKTTVILRRGTAEIESSGIGQMTTISLLQPESCPGSDGIQATLKKPAKAVVSKLEEENSFQLSAQEKLQWLAGTESFANKITVSTRSSDGVVDIEGINVAELGPDSIAVFQLNELLTLGVTSSDAKVKLYCDETISKGISEVGAQEMAGDVNILRTDLGMAGTDRPVPSRGQPSKIILTPTPVPTPTPAEGIPTPTPEEGIPVPVIPTEPIPPPIPPPVQTPVTHTFPQEPCITNIQVTPVFNGDNCPGAYSINVALDFQNYLPTILEGRLFSIETSDTWQPKATFKYPIPDPHTGPPPYLTMTSYSYFWPIEQVSVNYWFCYIPPIDYPDHVYFRAYIEDSAGNISVARDCDGNVGGPFTCGPYTCFP